MNKIHSMAQSKSVKERKQAMDELSYKVEGSGNKEKLRNNSFDDLILTLTVRIFLPCIPIFIERFVSFIASDLNNTFPNRDVLLVAFLIPIVWIIEIKNKVILLLASIFILLASVPFIISLIEPSQKVYLVGLILAIISIILFASLEILNYYKNRTKTYKTGRTKI